MNDQRQKTIKNISNFTAFEVVERNVINLEELASLVEKKKQLYRAKRAFLAQQINSNALEIVIAPIQQQQPEFKNNITNSIYDESDPINSFTFSPDNDIRLTNQNLRDQKTIPLKPKSNNKFKIYN